MPPTANAIDLTTYSAVKAWVTIPPGTTTDDQIIQDIVTGFSAYVLRLTGRGAMDGSIPAASPLVAPVAYAETYDGSGTNRQPIRNWPITAVSSLTIDGQTIPQSSSINVFGWVIDGDGRFVSLRGGYSANVATFQNYRFQGQRGSGVSFGFSAGTQNVQISYTAGFSGVPFDLEMTARKVCALNYKRRSWIGQKMQQLSAGAGMVQYNDFEMEPQDVRTIMYYQRRVA
jgi:hypothetical protein